MIKVGLNLGNSKISCAVTEINENKDIKLLSSLYTENAMVLSANGVDLASRDEILELVPNSDFVVKSVSTTKRIEANDGIVSRYFTCFDQFFEKIQFVRASVFSINLRNGRLHLGGRFFF